MKLKKYNEKRNFEKTSEPIGKVKNEKQNRFVVQYHEARAKHYDFRLEHSGVLLSWAVPKGFSYDTKVKRLAVKVEDHPLDYINFEGIIPKGNYGAGTVQIFDKGNYKPVWDMECGLKKGHLKFVLFGEKLKGEWSLLKTQNENWLLIKSDDEYSGREEQKLTKHKNPFSNCEVQLATLSEKIPKGKDWIFEIKYDGYRMLAFCEYGKVKLFSRNKIDYTNKFPQLLKELKTLCEKHSFVLDGEVVAFDENGRSDFALLKEKMGEDEGNLYYVVFDILAFQGEDLRDRSLGERKEFLKKLALNGHLLESEFVAGKGKECFALAKKMNLEGIVAKKISSTYNGTRDETWLKIKCRHRQEFVIAGLVTTEKNPALSALILGYYEGDKLIYVGKVGTGFNTENRLEIAKKLKKIAKKPAFFENFPKFNNENVIWVEPKEVAEIEFAELTKDKILRQPSFIALRFDKDAKSVFLEEKHEG